jgi:HAD superfamily hydrolase (TIGR01509 family)
MRLLDGIKAVVFDNNGTIYDDLGLAYGAMSEIFRRYELPAPSLEAYRQEVYSDYMEFYYSHGFSRDPNHPKFADAKALNAIRKEFFNANLQMAQFRPDAREVFKELEQRGLRLGIVSAENHSMLFNRLTECGLFTYFSFILADSTEKKSALSRMLQLLKLPAECVAYVDDTADGTGAAKKIGIRPIGFLGGYNSKERLLTVTELLISELSELLL